MKKVLSLFLSLFVLLSISLTACQSNKTGIGDGSQSDNKPKERVKLRIFFQPSGIQAPAEVDTQNNRWTDIYKTAFPEVDFDFIIVPPADAAEKKTLMMFANDFPDMVYATQKEITTWSQQDLIISLDDIIKKHYPNLSKFVKEEDMQVVKYNGKTWALPVPSNRLQNPDATYIRKDWLDKLNLKMPTTLDEARNVMKEFVTKDPDGNGKDDSFGLSSANNLDRMWDFYSPFDVQPGFYTRVNGKLMPDNIRPEMKDALAFIRKLYADGLLDNAVNQNANQLGQKVSQDKVGIYGNFSWNMSSLNQQIKSTFGGVYASMPPLKGPKGVQQIHSARDVGYLYAVTKSCKNPEYPAKILNWLLEQDKTKDYYALNADLINGGDVGVHSVLTGKYLSNLVESQLKGEGLVDRYRYTYRLVLGSMNIFTETDQIAQAEEMVKAGIMTQTWVDDKKNVAKYGKPNGRIFTGPIAAEKEGELNNYFNDVKMKIVKGELPIEAFDQWVDHFNKNGGIEIIDETNKLNPSK